jgi:Flp pilus assembly pilin Flp
VKAGIVHEHTDLGKGLNFMTKLRKTVSLGMALAMQGVSLQAIEREEGQTLAEYALILALIAVGVIVAVLALSGTISSLFNHVGSSI